ncbi:hypothetical protein DFH07DRAFT_851728 [Mycena maculata]|uniref:Uncharacterized protein n=1 Tax=Mycena maculata TaxID=230809 RepID=A0AAD7HUF9_9AGAR|nr:hypothetical protein DFH07DRAFT_851728 [Mycena maculata]
MGEDVQTANCDTTAQTCTVTVTALGFALVFLTDDSATQNAGAPSTTFGTTVWSQTHNTGRQPCSSILLASAMHVVVF